MKEKNPLYVVKGKTVLEAQGVFDMLMKRFNLEPLINVLMKVMSMLLEQVSTYPVFVAVKKMFDEVMGRLLELKQKFTPA